MMSTRRSRGLRVSACATRRTTAGRIASARNTVSTTTASRPAPQASRFSRRSTARASIASRPSSRAGSAASSSAPGVSCVLTAVPRPNACESPDARRSSSSKACECPATSRVGRVARAVRGARREQNPRDDRRERRRACARSAARSRRSPRGARARPHAWPRRGDPRRAVAVNRRQLAALRRLRLNASVQARMSTRLLQNPHR